MTTTFIAGALLTLVATTFVVQVQRLRAAALA
jgi:hypothetical protein